VAALALVAAADPVGARRTLGEPVALILIALALLGALSALWTLGPEERALRWAGVTLGYAAVFGAAAVAARTPRGALALAAGVGAIAAVSAGLALGAAALHEEPYALRIGGDWRPAGPLEYPPALALLVVCALPVFVQAVRARSRPLRLAGIGALGLSATVLVLAQSRIGLALALLIATLVVYRVSRRPALAAVGIAVAIAAGSLAFGPGDGPPSGFLHGREDTWNAAVDTFLDRPLHGTGADAFLAGSARHQGGAAIVFAHNLPLELAVELGIAGLLLALALYAAVGRLVWMARSSQVGWLFGPAAIGFLIANLLDWPWHLAGLGAVWSLACGALAGTRASPAKLPGRPLFQLQGDQ
jgi:O-antigen ligase